MNSAPLSLTIMPCLRRQRTRAVSSRATRWPEIKVSGTVDEIERLISALEAMVAGGSNPKSLMITLLWLFTGGRRNEIAGLKWSEVRLDGLSSEILLEDSKTGKSWRPTVQEAYISCDLSSPPQL